MDRQWLKEELQAGRSIESIAREAGRDPSTVAYWVHSYDLVSSHAERHAARGGIEREQLEDLVAEGLSIREIAVRVDRSPTTVRHWLREYGLKTLRERRPKVEDVDQVERRCATHGIATFVRYGPRDHFRCVLCRRQRVTNRRRRVKEILVAEAGGACRLCGYDRTPAALHFHHVDPNEKSFALALQGVARSLDRCRTEAQKCVLLCANCHAEVEAGLARLP